MQTLLTRMPAHFAKDENSNNYKLLSLIASGSEETHSVYETMLKFWDVDQAFGIGLDRIGKDEGISRGAWDDEEYRKMIKIQNIMNLSEGDIPSMNLILDAYMGSSFKGMRDGYTDLGPATLVAHLNSASEKLPMNIVNRIKPTGVKVYWMLEELVAQLEVIVKAYEFSVMYPFANTFVTAEVEGKLFKDTVGIQHRSYTFGALQPICGTFVTSTINSVVSNLNVELVNEYRAVEVPYRRAGESTITGEGEI
ncbi:hypothetical protein [Solibacillus isronensis]|uniref:hypothetical protein n=1 Tax=Solibacillus isronensis TaxID=412383 RepID=UPI0039A04A3F